MTLLILMFYGGRTSQAIFTTWPQNEEVGFVWQATLTEIGRYLDQNPQIKDATVVGWTPDTMDAPTMALSTYTSPATMRHIGTTGPSRTLVIPLGGTILQPHELPLHDALSSIIPLLQRETERTPSFIAYHFPNQFSLQPQHPHDQLFSSELRWLGYDQLSNCDEELCVIRTYWRVEKRPAHGRRFFLHALDEDGQTIAQDDSLHAPSQFWQPGDILIHVHELPPTAEAISYHLGIYDPTPPYPRLITAENRDHLSLSLK